MRPPDETIRIVHVDDEPDFADLSAAFLRRADARMAVETATGVSEALAHLEEHDADCIVSDHEMGDLTGIDLLETVREDHPDLPFILFTGKGTEEVASRAISAGVTDYIQKEGGVEQFTVLANRITNAVGQRESERQFRTLVNNLPGIVYRARNTPGWTSEFIGGEVTSLTGYTAAEFRAGDVRLGDDLIHPEDRSRVWNTVQECVDADEPFELTYRIITKDGDVRWVWERGETVETSDAGAEILEGFITEVTEQKQREWKLERLREWTRDLTYTRTVEETTRLAAEAADETIGAPLSGVHLLSADGTRLEPSSLASSVHGSFDTLPSFDRSSPAGSRGALAWEAFEGAEPIHIGRMSTSSRISEESPAESVILYPIGDHGLFIISGPDADAFTDTDVLLVEILAYHLEAALDRVNREGTLRSREKRLERLHHATRGLIRAESQRDIADRVRDAAEGILDFPVTVVRLFDPAVDGLVPVAESEAVDDVLPDRDVFTGGGGSLNWAAYESGEVSVFNDIETVDHAVDQGTGLRSLMILPMGAYGTISVGSTTRAAFDATDEFLGRILSTAAETALEAEERGRQLRNTRDEFKRQNDRLDAFASFVSHDLQNPLSVATGRLELARSDCDSEHLDAVARAHDRMGSLITDLLAFARAGEGALDLEAVELGPLVDRCWRTFETGTATVAVETDRSIIADHDRLRQLLENLLGNAVKHGDDGVTVTIGDLDGGFYVTDDGPGIPASRFEDVFEAGHSTIREGTGFGLSVVKLVAETHGWDVRIVDGVDGGARFEITGVEVVE